MTAKNIGKVLGGGAASAVACRAVLYWSPQYPTVTQYLPLKVSSLPQHSSTVLYWSRQYPTVTQYFPVKTYPPTAARLSSTLLATAVPYCHTMFTSKSNPLR